MSMYRDKLLNLPIKRRTMQKRLQPSYLRDANVPLLCYGVITLLDPRSRFYKAPNYENTPRIRRQSKVRYTIPLAIY